MLKPRLPDSLETATAADRPLPGQGLGAKARQGARWQGLSQLVEFTLAGGTFVLLANYVSPTIFGWVTLGAAVVAILLGILAAPVGAAVVAKQIRAGPCLDTAWWLVSVPAGCVYAVVVATALFLGVGGLTLGVIIGVGGSLPLMAALQILTAHCQQQLAFKRLAVAQLIASVLSALGTVILFITIDPSYALILRPALVPLLQGTLIFLLIPWWPRMTFQMAAARTIFAYARGVAGFNAVNQLSRRGDDILVAGLVGSYALGLYSIAYRFIEVPVNQVSQVAHKVTFPSLVRITKEAQTRSAFLRSQRILVWLAAPVSIGSVALGDVAIPAFFGDEWTEAGPIVQMFGIITLLQAASTQTSILYLYRAATNLLMVWGVGSTVVILVCLLAGSYWGLMGIAWGYLAANLILLYPSWAIAGRLIALKPTEVVKSLNSVVGLAAVTVLGMLGVRAVAPIDSADTIATALVMISLLYWSLSLAADASLRSDVALMITSRRWGD